AMSAPPRSARLPAWPAHARRPLLFRLRACSCIWSSRESDDLSSGSRSARTASAAFDRGTCGFSAGQGGDELVDVGVGEHAALALTAVSHGDVVERAAGDIAADRLGGAAKLGGDLFERAQPVRRALARLAGARPRLGLHAIALGAGQQAVERVALRVA